LTDRLRTTLVIPVPEAEPLVRELRMRHDPNEAMGLRAHVTVLGPFLPSDRIQPADSDRLQAIFGGIPAFRYSLATVGWFGDRVLYLAPQPVRPFATLTAAVAAEWGLRPYGRTDGAVRPHLTIARAEGIAGAAALVPLLQSSLPVAAAARGVRLYGTDEISWRLLESFRLGSAVARAPGP
jgi:2'-5' RNA ligase